MLELQCQSSIGNADNGVCLHISGTNCGWVHVVNQSHCCDWQVVDCNHGSPTFMEKQITRSWCVMWVVVIVIVLLQWCVSRWRECFQANPAVISWKICHTHKQGACVLKLTGNNYHPCVAAPSLSHRRRRRCVTWFIEFGHPFVAIGKCQECHCGKHALIQYTHARKHTHARKVGHCVN